MDLKLAKLPDRTPVKIVITVSPDLNRMLGQYMSLYNQQHSTEETISALCPYILKAFLESDRNFLKACKKNVLENENLPPSSMHHHERRTNSKNSGVSSGRATEA